MRKIQIFTDSCSDLNEDLLTRYGIDYVRMNTVEDGKESPAILTGGYDYLHPLYETMRTGKRITTTQVPAEEFVSRFTPVIEAGCDIIYIACCVKQTGSVNTGRVVSKKLMADHPECRIECIDSLNACIGEGMLAIKAAQLAAEGKTFDEVVEGVMACRNNVRQFVTVHSLDALKRAGRVKGSTAFFGNLMGVKPILVADADGEQTPIKKAKGRMGSIKEVVALLKAEMPSAKDETVYVAHADCSKEEVQMLVDLVKQEIPCKAIETVFIGPIIGASIGPDAIGVWGFGNEITYRAADQK